MDRDTLLKQQADDLRAPAGWQVEYLEFFCRLHFQKVLGSTA